MSNIVARRQILFFPAFIVICVASLTISAQVSETDYELFVKAQTDLKRAEAWPSPDVTLTKRAGKTLKEILQRSSDTPLRYQINSLQTHIDEIVGQHNLAFAIFFQVHGRGLLGAESRLKDILINYPGFSKTDEVLSRLADIDIRLEKPEDARDYLSRLVCEYPASAYASSAFERLNTIGMWKQCEIGQK